MIAVVRPSRASTSGRSRVGMKPCTNELYVSLIIRCDSAAIVPNTSELLPEPETPVNTVSRRLGSSMLTFLRLFSRAPCTRIRSWLSASCGMLAMLAGAADDQPLRSRRSDRDVYLRPRSRTRRHLPGEHRCELVEGDGGRDERARVDVAPRVRVDRGAQARGRAEHPDRRHVLQRERAAVEEAG